MKYTLFGLAVVSTFAFSVNAQDHIITNKTYPERKIEITCQIPMSVLDSGDTCSIMTIKAYDGETLTYSNDVNKLTLKSTAKNKRKYFKRDKSPYMPFALTGMAGSKIGKKWREGYHGKAIGNIGLTLGAFIVDTAALPISLASRENAIVFMDSKQDKKAAKRVLRMIDKMKFEKSYKEKQFMEIWNYLNGIKYVENTMIEKSANDNFNYNKFLDGTYANCQLVSKVNENHQLYLNGELADSFDSRNPNEMHALRLTLRLMEAKRVCYQTVDMDSADPVDFPEVNDDLFEDIEIESDYQDIYGEEMQEEVEINDGI
jgi:hypothetical protein